MTDALRYRQIHLDFHTSEAIEHIARDFDADAFAASLAAAHVDSVTCFARCHHGWLYYPSEAFPERIHPHLERRDLLGEQIAACHARGIRVPIYITVQWDEYSAEAHPEWLAVDADGRIAGTPPYEAGFYRRLLVNSPYRDFLVAQTREVLDRYPVDGIFFDIVHALDDSSVWTRRGMLAAGLDPADRTARLRWGRRVIEDFMREMTALVRRRAPGATVFYNAGHVGPHQRGGLEADTHLEIESLPGGHWGYGHFPLAVRYARTLGLPCLGMTGKFHTQWGDFHSFKHPAALAFECFHALAQGAACSIGDQLHPHGRLCPDTYRLIGEVYAAVAAKEPWCAGARARTEVAILSPEAFAPDPGPGMELPPAAGGAVRLLQELRCQFDVIDPAADLAAYRLLVLPDAVPVDTGLATALRTFLAAGGALLASHRSGLTPAGDACALPELGIEPLGDAEWAPDFLVPGPELATGLPAGELVMYDRALAVRPDADAAVLAGVDRPFFERGWRHWCSHRHTPSSGEPAGYPGVVAKGRCVYLAHPVFATYAELAPPWIRSLLGTLLGRLLPEPLLRVEGPSTLIATCTAQPAGAGHGPRLVVHLLHYIPERRGRSAEVVADVIPLHAVPVSLCVDAAVRGVSLVPEDAPLDHRVEDGRCTFTVPRIDGHRMVAVELAG